MENLTLAENSVFADVDVEFEVSAWESPLTTFLVVTDILIFVPHLASSIASVLIIWAIWKSNKLREKEPNWHIFHYAILSIAQFFIFPMSLMLIELFTPPGSIFCAHYRADLAIRVLTFLFAVNLQKDWIFFTFKPKALSFYYRILSITKRILVTYAIGLIKFFFVLVSSCLHLIDDKMYFNLLYLRIIYVVLCVYCLIIIFVQYRIELSAIQQEYIFCSSVSSIIVLASLPSFIVWEILDEFYMYDVLRRILLFLFFFADVLAGLSPVLVLTYLYIYNKHYKMSLDFIFRRVNKSYVADDLDDLVEDGGNDRNNQVKFEVAGDRVMGSLVD